MAGRDGKTLSTATAIAALSGGAAVAGAAVGFDMMLDAFETIPNPPNVLAWLGFLGAGVGAAGGIAGLAVPQSRRLLLPEIRETRLRDHVLFDRVLADGHTVRCTDGSLFQVIAVEGIDLGARDDDTQEQRYQERKRWVDGLAGSRCDMRILTVRTLKDQAADVSDYPEGVLRDVQGKWHATFKRSFHNTHYIVLSVKGGTEAARVVLGDAAAMTLDRLREHRPRVLEVGRPGETSPLLSFLAGRLNPGREVRVGAWRGTPARRGPDGRIELGELNRRLVDGLLASQVVFFDGLPKRRKDDGLAVFRDGSHETWMGAWGIGSWGEVSMTEIGRRILSVDAEMTVFQTLKVWDNTLARTHVREKMGRTMRGQEERQEGVDTKAVGQYRAALTLLQAEGPERMELCDHQYIVFVHGYSREDLEYRMGLVRQALDDFLILPVRETSATEPLWFSQFPPHFENVRAAEIMSGNVAHFTSFETPTKGLSRCDWGERAVTRFKTSSGSPYDLCFHRSDQPLDVGHTLMIGGTGAGKSTLLGWLASSCLGFPNARVFCIDRSDGLFVPVLSFGGTYVNLQTDTVDIIGDVCQLNPLQQPLDPRATGGPTIWTINWLRDHVTRCRDKESEEWLNKVVRSIAEHPPARRRLFDIYDAIPDDVPAKHELARWVAGGNYSYLFDGARDTLSFDGGSRLTAFDFTRIGEDDIANQAVLPYLAYRIETEMQRVGAPWLFALDEAAAVLKDGVFRDWLFKLIQEARRMRGVVVVCLQRVGSLAERGVGELLLTQCPTKILFRNVEASEEEYIEVLGLTRTEFEIVKGVHPTAKQLGRHYVLIKREGEGSVVLDVNLGPLGKDLALLQSGKEPADRLRRLIRQEGGNIDRAVARLRAAGMLRQ
jgi:type IV secretion/conjugal transfer VirB4 family ATPase